MTNASKYVVFKRTDFVRFIQHGAFPPDELNEIAITDAWVVRPQDTHAPSTVYAYANAIQTTLEILDNVNPPESVLSDMINTQREQLAKIRDAAFEFAENARHTSHRLPD